jgi:hypothetical protein
MKKAILILLLSLSFFALTIQMVNAQDFYNLAIKSKSSLNGLEVSDYKKVRIKIEREGPSVEQIGPTEERIKEKIELRLRQAGLEPLTATGPFDHLLINIQVVTNAFNIRIQFNRFVLFEAKGSPYHTIAPTWMTDGTGIHVGRSEFIIETLDKYFDTFLKQYLKANAK